MPGAANNTACTVKHGPSLLFNNLTTSSQGLAYVHGNQAATGLLEHSDKVQQVQMCPLADFTCIVIALGTGMQADATSSHTTAKHTPPALDSRLRSATLPGVSLSSCDSDHSTGLLQVWDAAGSQLLFSWALPPTKLVSGLAPVPTFARGIAANIAADGSAQICLGASSGLVYIFDAPRPSSIALVAALQHHTSAVTALGSSWQGRRGNLTNDVTCSLVSSDDGGAVCLWEAASASSYTQRHALMGHGTPCVALAVRGETVVAAFQDGVVRLHDMVTMRLKLELQAHSRLLSCMAIHPSRDIFVTAAEDATCNVWTLPLTNSDQMSVLLSVCWNNMAITGAVFTGDDDSDNSLVAAVAYDTDTLQLWQLP